MSRLYVGSKTHTIDHIKNCFPGFEIIQCDQIENSLNSYSVFFDSDKIFLHINPKSEELKLIESAINNEKGINFLYYDSETYDGRNSLIQKIKKNNLIFLFNYPIYGDTSNFTRQVLSYSKKINLEINNECLNWLKINGPVLKIKSKADKKEVLYYDLDLLYRTLDKYKGIKKDLNLNDLVNQNFNIESDLFLFFEYIFKKDIKNIFQSWDKIVENLDAQSVVIIFFHQLVFIIEMIGLKQKHNDFNNLLNKMELNDLLGKYLNEEWQECNFTAKKHNPIRLKIELSKDYYNIEYLSKLLQISYDTISNFRNNYNKDLTVFSFLNRICYV